MAKKLSIGSWAYTFGPYTQNPVPFDTVVKRLGELGFDGVEIGAFKPHIDINDYPMRSDRQAVKGLIAFYGLEVSGLAADFWSHPGPGTNEAQEDDRYFKLFKRNLQLALDLGSPSIRVDTVGNPEKGVEGVDRQTAWNRIVELWRRCAHVAEDHGVLMVWEFEPGFMFNKPGEIVALVNEVNHPNFKVLFDTCHAHMCAAVGARQPGKKETLGEDGVIKLARMLEGKIGHFHLIDSDNTLHDNETSTHAPFGQGVLDFDRIIPVIMEETGYNGEWFAIDLCFWPEAWEVTENAKRFLAPYLERY
jgi:sugar phosphate isomerase/epimerase